MSKGKLKASVILITYNQETYVKETLQSILNQTYDNFEILVGDDSSKDRTQQVVKSFNDDRIKYYNTPFNMGINGNNNNVIKEATGDIICLIAGDDRLRRNYLEKIVDTFEKNKDIDVIYSQMSVIDKDGKYKESENKAYCRIPKRTIAECIHYSFYVGNFTLSPGMAFRTYLKNKIFPQEYSIINYQDYKIHIDLIAKGCKNIVLDDILVDYRIFQDERNISNLGEDTTKRQILETPFLMDAFLKIDDIQLLKEAFKQEIKQTGIEPYIDTIPFFLGQMALLAEEEPRKEWGYRTIINFLKTLDNYNLVHSRYNFSFVDLLNLIKKFKPEIYCTKYKKYKRLFNTSLSVSIILLAILISVLIFD